MKTPRFVALSSLTHCLRELSGPCDKPRCEIVNLGSNGLTTTTGPCCTKAEMELKSGKKNLSLGVLDSAWPILDLGLIF